MPSAATAKLEKQASTEAVDPIKQVIIVVEHKIRNLEKRKRKIESYREEEKNGKVLNSDQLNAVSKFNEVQQTLEFARELNKQFQGIAADAAKQQKKLARKEALERAQQEHAKVKEILLVQDVLQSMGQDTVREDFLAGRNGAAQLTEEDLKYLDDLYVEVSPKHGGEEGTPSFQDQVNLSAEHLLAIVEGKPKELVGTTCAKLKEIVTTIVSCGYFDQSVEEAVEETAGENVAPEGEVPTNAVAEETAAAVAVEEPAVYPVPEQPAVCPDETAPTFPAGAQPTFAPSQTQPARVINEVIGSVGGTFNFLQESELDTPDISAILTGAAAQQHSTPPPPQPAAVPVPVPVAVAPIPSQTFTNQNFAAVTTAPGQPQVVFQAPAEMTQAHIPGFASTTPNPPPPIPMPPSHQTQPVVPSQPSAQFAAAAATVQQQQIMSATFVSQAKPQQQPPAFVPAQQQKQDISPAVVVPEQQPIPDTKTAAQGNTSEWQQVETTTPSGDWGNTENQAAGDWGTPENAVAADDWKGTDNAGSGDEWQHVSSQGDWSNQTSEEWSTAGQTDNYATQSGRNYGGRGGRGGRGGGGRGSSNGYSGRGRGGSGYQNGRGGGSSGGGGYGYRNSEGGSNYYQNGYQQRENFSGGGNYAGGYKRGGRGGPGGPRGAGQRGGPGNRGGNNPRGGRGGNFPRGGGNKQ
ncbi:caprin homolog isoform X1 [Schistocerca nitens]|uniref:caprin homolog isoform X1 n=1 Tax=Schistocerca nitens TaxID=7011 RepID=UPI0021181DC4|nr:caprin homolog isoform X1 [Schistocerca nitens]